MNKIKEAFRKAIKVLEKTATPHGFHAAYPGYKGVWARDSIITSLGASLIEKKFRSSFKQSLIILSKNQSEKGQIPNAVLHKKPLKVDYKSIDSTLWFIIGHYLYKSRYKDSNLFRKYKKSIEKAFNWLSFQDMGEDNMLEQLPTTDWQDAFPHRYGHTINTQALYFKTLNLSNNKKKAIVLKEIVNKNKEDGLWNGNFYIPWRWKNHGQYKEKGKWFDSLGNLLAILFDLANDYQSKKILSYIKKKKIDRPYPIKSIYPAISKKSKDWQDYFLDSEASKPYHYLNGGIWTYIGGFYVLSLIKNKDFKYALFNLEKLAEANLRDNTIFSEWLDGKKGKPSRNNDNQAWNAGMYILAYLSIKKKKVLL